LSVGFFLGCGAMLVDGCLRCLSKLCGGLELSIVACERKGYV
jgi:hypothetical protein